MKQYRGAIKGNDKNITGNPECYNSNYETSNYPNQKKNYEPLSFLKCYNSNNYDNYYKKVQIAMWNLNSKGEEKA